MIDNAHPSYDYEKAVSIDIETTGLDWSSRVLTVGICVRERYDRGGQIWVEEKIEDGVQLGSLRIEEYAKTIYYPDGWVHRNVALNLGMYDLFNRPVSIPYAAKVFKAAIKDADYIIGHNFMFDLAFLFKLHLLDYNEVKDRVLCTLNMARCTAPHERFGLDAMVQEYALPIRDVAEYEEMKKLRGKLEKVDPVRVLNYQTDDIEVTMHLFTRIWHLIQDQYDYDFVRLEGKFIALLAEMRVRGLALNQKRIKRLISELNPRYNEILQTLVRNGIDSPNNKKHVVKFIRKFRHTVRYNPETGQPMLDKHILIEYPGVKEALARNTGELDDGLESTHFGHILALILEGRDIEKKLQTWLKGFSDVADSTGRIHPLYSITTKSGALRLTSSYPNPLAVHRDIKMWGLDEGGAYNYLVQIDYTQAEIYLAAAFSRENKIAQAVDKGKDIHTTTAQLMYPGKEITKDLRRFAKGANFGSLYGGGPPGLSRVLNVPEKVAAGIISLWRGVYSNMHMASRLAKERWEEKGFVRLTHGKRRWASERDLRKAYKAFNQLVQSSVAECMKHAMVRIDDELFPHVRLVCQIHDSIFLEMTDLAYLPICEQMMIEAVPQDLLNRTTPPLRMKVDSEIMFERQEELVF